MWPWAFPSIFWQGWIHSAFRFHCEEGVWLGTFGWKNCFLSKAGRMCLAYDDWPDTRLSSKQPLTEYQERKTKLLLLELSHGGELIVEIELQYPGWKHPHLGFVKC